MVLPQAMAWVQYWFRVLSLKFCGKSKKFAVIYHRYHPLFACMPPSISSIAGQPWVSRCLPGNRQLVSIGVVAASVEPFTGRGSSTHPGGWSLALGEAGRGGRKLKGKGGGFEEGTIFGGDGSVWRRLWWEFEIERSVICTGWLAEWERNIVATYEWEEELWRMKITNSAYVTLFHRALLVVF